MKTTDNHSDLHSKMENFWLNKFSGLREKSYFHYDLNKKGQQSSPAQKRFQLPGELFSQLMKLCNGSDHRLHMILVAGIIALLNKYTGNRDITLAMPAYKQEGRSLDTVLPLRNEVNPGASFKELLLHVRQSILEAVENQNYPMELLMNHLKKQQRDSSLFQLAVLLENVHDPQHLRHLDMCFLFNRTGEGLEGILQYDAALYLETSIQGLVHHFTRLLEHAAFNLETPLHQLEMLSAREINQLVFEFNDRPMYYLEEKIPDTAKENRGAFILGKNLNLLPVAAVGELFIGGTNDAAGYLNNPQLTPDKSARLFPTGGLARRLPDGEIEFLGDIHRRVIIDGFSVQPGQIENLLENHDALLDAVVTVREKKHGHPYLCAYFVGVEGSEQESSSSKLREFLKSQLPQHMIPSYFVRMQEIPLTSEGKPDQTMLPEPEEGSSGLKSEYVAPQTEQERLLAEIWGEILETGNVGLYDNFFDLGGNSIHAISVISQVHKEFSTRIPISVVFNRPTISGLAKTLSKEREDALPDVGTCPRSNHYPLSHSQMRLWFFAQMEPDNPAYNVPSIMRISGDFDKAVFKETWSALADRHEALRTAVTVVEQEGPNGVEEIPVQVIRPSVDIDIRQMDMSELPGVEREEALLKIVEEESKKPFDLEQAPLFRVVLIKLEYRQHVLGFIVHHIISDNWSTRVITREFASFYPQLQKGLLPQLPPLEIQYKDFSYWQTQMLSENRLHRQKQYWHEKLAGQLPVLDLPGDYSRPTMQSSRGDHVIIEMDAQLTRQLKHLSREKLATMFMILTAAFKALLYRYTNQEDAVVGTLIAGRTGSGLEKIVGYFVNILALRDDVTGSMTFDEFLGRVKRTMLDAYDNQDYPFDKLVDELKVERDLGRSPVFDTMLVYQNIEESSQSFSSLDSLNITPFGKTYVVSKYDIYLDISNYSDYIRINVEFCLDLFKKETIEKMFRHYVNLLRSALHTPGSSISNLDIMLEQEKKQLLEDFNNTNRDFPRDRCYHELFQQQVLETPDAIAVRHNGETLTYIQLNKKANRMAQRLSHHGAGKIVALYMKRSINMLASILAVFKAGCAYMPMEIDYPVERTRFLIQDSGTAVIISHSERKEELEAVRQQLETPLQIVCWQDGSVENLANHNTPQPCTPQDNAYMIYTSGTTGRPKGVLIHQQGMTNHLYAKIADLEMTRHDRVAHTASQCFDISVWQFLAALLTGGTVVIFDFEIVLDPEAMLRGLQEEKITIFESVPSLMTVFLEMIENKQEARLDHLRWMIPTGEALKPALVHRWFRYYPAIKLVNAYGPTEASDDITHYIIHSPSDVGQLTVPIGKPVQNMRIYILDKDLSLCPAGVRGEICVAGLGVGKGYWGDPEKTNRAFIANPYAGMNCEYELLYKTGDIGYFRDDGNIECLGRIDNQVKIRGFRIELEEIEAMMNRFPAINECAVIVTKKHEGPDSIVGFFVEGEPVDLEELKSFLLDYLPGYMIPPLFVKLEQLPLAISGKADRRALAAMDIGSSAADAVVEFVAPEGRTPTIIAGIWTDVLEKESVGVNDNFFDIGGHSLLVPRIHRKLEKQFPGKCKIADLFEYMTISRLSHHIDGTIEGDDDEIIELSVD